MGWIQTPGQDRVLLRAHHLIGRSTAMHTTLGSSNVSAQHLAVFWSGQHWLARDLGSTNGTRLNGVPLKVGVDVPLQRGVVLELGGSAERVVLIDDGPPIAFAVHPGGEVRGDVDFLALPSPEQPIAVLTRDSVGSWRCFQEEQSRPVLDGDSLTINDQRWDLVLPDVVEGTQRLSAGSDAELSLHFQVSSDEEYIELTVSGPHGALQLPPRVHHHLLLTLARHRLREQDRPAAEQGWCYSDELCRMLGMKKNRFYVTLHRLRKDLEKHRLLDGAPLIEHRTTTHQFRLGTSRISISPKS